MQRHRFTLITAIVLHLLMLASPLSAAQLSGWIEAQPAAVNLSTEGTSDWIHGGLNGDPTYLVRKAGAGLISGLTVENPNNNGALVRGAGATLSWSDGSPEVSCAGTTQGVHAQGATNVIRVSVPAEPTARTVRVYFSSVHAGVKVTARLSDGSAPDWVNDDWYATTGTITPMLTLSVAAASAGQTLSICELGVFSCGDALLEHRPFATSEQRVEPPMDEDPKSGLMEPAHAVCVGWNGHAVYFRVDTFYHPRGEG